MPKGISLHIGIDRVDKERPGYSDLIDLPAAPGDAAYMSLIARDQGFHPTLLHPAREATLERVATYLECASRALQTGDILLITFAGHGLPVPEPSRQPPDPTRFPGCDNRPIEEDGRDERLCCYDAPISDNDLYSIWCSFRPGVRIVLVADCCFSGTVHELRADAVVEGRSLRHSDILDVRFTARREARTVEIHTIPPMVLLISASQDGTRVPVEEPGEPNGLFTRAFRGAWRRTPRDDNYVDFYNSICEEFARVFPQSQPNYRLIGSDRAALARFERQPPLSI